METLKLNMDDPTAVSLMVLGTENRKIFVLDSQGMRVVKKIELEARASSETRDTPRTGYVID